MSLEAQVGACPYYISNESRYHKTANAFGVSHELISSIIGRASHAVSISVGLQIIKLPMTNGSKRTG